MQVGGVRGKWGVRVSMCAYLQRDAVEALRKYLQVCFVQVGRMTRAVLDAVNEVSSIAVVWIEVGHMARAVLDADSKVSRIMHRS
jgi:hypothetical protein